ncbi:hypothetical protein DFJ73DRAFT_922430, partial [Zopfochytrium polystomum]
GQSVPRAFRAPVLVDAPDDPAPPPTAADGPASGRRVAHVGGDRFPVPLGLFRQLRVVARAAAAPGQELHRRNDRWTSGRPGVLASRSTGDGCVDANVAGRNRVGKVDRRAVRRPGSRGAASAGATNRHPSYPDPVVPPHDGSARVVRVSSRRPAAGRNTHLNPTRRNTLLRGPAPTNSLVSVNTATAAAASSPADNLPLRPHRPGLHHWSLPRSVGAAPVPAGVAGAGNRRRGQPGGCSSQRCGEARVAAVGAGRGGSRAGRAPSCGCEEPRRRRRWRRGRAGGGWREWQRVGQGSCGVRGRELRGGAGAATVRCADARAYGGAETADGGAVAGEDAVSSRVLMWDTGPVHYVIIFFFFVGFFFFPVQVLIIS